RAITSTRAPGSTRSLRTGVLAGVRPTRTAIEVQLDQFQYPSAKSFTPKYRLCLLRDKNSDVRERFADPRCAIFPIAEAADKLGNSTLAIDVGSGGDPRIFEYRELTLFDDRRRDQLDGKQTPVFDSWFKLLDHIVALDS